MSKTYNFVVPPESIKAFSAQGFVLTPDVFSAAQVTQFSEAVDAAVADRTALDSRKLADKNRYEQSFIQCMRLWETHPSVAELSLHPALAAIAAQLLGVEDVTLWQDQALYKEAGGKETTPHQDQPFWPISDSPMVSAWIPFDAIRPENGAMSYVPGSHRVGRLKIVDITHSTEPYDILNDSALKGLRPQTISVDPGSVIWHHGMTVHAASENRSQQSRRAFTVVYLDRRATRTKPWPSYPLDRANVSVGDVVQGPGLPQVWPPSTARPEVPEQIGRKMGPQ